MKTATSLNPCESCSERYLMHLGCCGDGLGICKAALDYQERLRNKNVFKNERSTQ